MFQYIIAFIVISHIRKSQQTAKLLPRWDKIFLGMLVAAASLLALRFSNSATEPITDLLVHMIVLALVIIIYKKEEFKPVRSVLFAALPLIIVLFLGYVVKFLAKDYFDVWGKIFGAATFFSIIWLVTMFIITNRQKKDLEKERVKTHEEEQKNKFMATMKTELEAQVAERTTELTSQKETLEHALTELKATQAQLIQSEKLASLGELTAGIAHEIQNPLNFVNNFSEVSVELLEELKDGPFKHLPESEQSLANEIMADITQNLQKIHHHGKRADDIVKGMLLHSRTSTGQKEPADINALADEYLRLSYHGLRAKNKSFNATMKVYFDKSIGNINIIPQDIGRVILNLFTNAFHAVAEKKKLQPQGYEPTVSVSTRKLSRGAEIRVKDNGNGIPQKIIDKIFEPFFTTKPTGQGTGLGLSLSYDIIKAHNGEIKVETKEGEFTVFIITLPA